LLLVPELELVALSDQHYAFVERRELAQRWRNQNPAGAVKLHVVGVTDEEALQPANLVVETGQRHQALLNRLPLGRRIEQQAAARIRGQHHVTVGTRQQRFAMFGRNGQAPLVVER
jgi:hypothetical protein